MTLVVLGFSNYKTGKKTTKNKGHIGVYNYLWQIKKFRKEGNTVYID